MDLGIKGLLHEHESLSLTPRTTWKKNNNSAKPLISTPYCGLNTHT